MATSGARRDRQRRLHDARDEEGSLQSKRRQERRRRGAVRDGRDVQRQWIRECSDLYRP